MEKTNIVLEGQQKINDAAKTIMDYFSGEVPYDVHLEHMIEAENQIVGMMDLVRQKMITDPMEELEYLTDEIPLFLRDVHLYLKMLKPFVELVGQTGFNNKELVA